ncbi:hypothetical protein KZZ52_12335 [Dactylosporangium sp. AC04546]|uniref:hypothetical protein n=1 Tax=Dactylosporangium sp. AC04546 TaxID=2862460 RepID=UPI001EDE2599|nr:hypothetical protein [Dactylosporangium sp. AC04546]WVK86128.1 hypothetical protein KZZ52_12335 [Dactylosporangium sp. AC04546]
MKRLLLAGSIACATILFTAACGDDKKADTPAAAPSAANSGAPAADASGSAAPSGSAKASGAASGKAGQLSYQTVAKLTGELFTKDPDCPVGQWDSNSTGVDAKYRSAVATFKQFDCYEKKGAMMPHRGQQAIFVEFKSANAAKAYAQDQAKMYPTLIVGNTVVVAGTGLKDTDMKAYLESVQETAGGAGQILNGKA